MSFGDLCLFHLTPNSRESRDVLRACVAFVQNCVCLKRKDISLIVLRFLYSTNLLHRYPLLVFSVWTKKQRWHQGTECS